MEIRYDYRTQNRQSADIGPHSKKLISASTTNFTQLKGSFVLDKTNFKEEPVIRPNKSKPSQLGLMQSSLPTGLPTVSSSKNYRDRL